MRPEPIGLRRARQARRRALAPRPQAAGAGQGVAVKPKLLLLDEIAGGLTDAESETCSTSSAIHREGVTIVWVEHVIQALKRIVSRLAVLYRRDHRRRRAGRGAGRPARARRVPRRVIRPIMTSSSGRTVFFFFFFFFFFERRRERPPPRGDKLSVFYDEFQAVDDVDVSMDEGEMVSIIGANGAGKSTLLKAIVGQAGRVRAACGSTARTLPAARRARSSPRRRARPEGRKLSRRSPWSRTSASAGSSGARATIGFDQVYEWFPVLEERRDSRRASSAGGQQQMVALGRACSPIRASCSATRSASASRRVVVNELYEIIPSSATGASRSSWSSRTSAARSRSPTASIACSRATSRSRAGPRTRTATKIMKHYFGV